MAKTSDYRTGRHVISTLHVHLVFVTKYRRAILTPAMLEEMTDWFSVVCSSYEAVLVEVNGDRDHVHLLIEYPAKVAVSKMVNSLKGVSSRRFREKYTDALPSYFIGSSLWSPSYFAGSCGGAALEQIKQYIANQ